jgi:FG-GAP-like repeat
MKLTNLLAVWRLIVAASLFQFAQGLSSERDQKFQPKVVLTVEANPSQRIFGSLSLANGSSWCNGKPTFWLVGHQIFDETPWCLDPPQRNVNNTSYTRNSFLGFDYSTNGTKFSRPRRVVLDTVDVMNGASRGIDRHDCAVMDVNHDGKLDVICAVGADMGKGTGFTEVYLTVDNAFLVNKLQKVPRGHGLQKYPSTRSRLVERLRGADGSELIFIATRGEPRSDNLTNVHRMYRHVKSTLDASATTANATAHPNSFYFEDVPGPWELMQTDATCLIVADLNGDGIDDIIICNSRATPLIYLQSYDGTFLELPYFGIKKWRQARVADVTGDGIVDLVVSTHRERELQVPPLVSIYKGYKSYPHFDWSQPYFERKMQFGTPSVEVLDVNSDGVADIYIVQTDETTLDTYCGGGLFDNRKWWASGNYPPASFVPPRDLANDLLLVGNGYSKRHGVPFTEVYLNHSEPGCGFFTQLFGDNRTMILGQGTNSRPGHSLLLQW